MSASRRFIGWTLSATWGSMGTAWLVEECGGAPGMGYKSERIVVGLPKARAYETYLKGRDEKDVTVHRVYVTRRKRVREA